MFDIGQGFNITYRIYGLDLYKSMFLNLCVGVSKSNVMWIQKN